MPSDTSSAERAQSDPWSRLRRDLLLRLESLLGTAVSPPARQLPRFTIKVLRCLLSESPRRRHLMDLSVAALERQQAPGDVARSRASLKALLIRVRSQRSAPKGDAADQLCNMLYQGIPQMRAVLSTFVHRPKAKSRPPKKPPRRRGEKRGDSSAWTGHYEDPVVPRIEPSLLSTGIARRKRKGNGKRKGKKKKKIVVRNFSPRRKKAGSGSIWTTGSGQTRKYGSHRS
jgi:hypothetical protein